MEHSVRGQKFKAVNLGATKNSLGILSRDHRFFHPSKVSKITKLSPTRLSKVLKLSRTMMYRSEVKISAQLKKAIAGLVAVTDIAWELMGKDTDELSVWLMAPNTMFLGDSPFEICMRGDAEPIMRWLAQRAGLETGAAF